MITVCHIIMLVAPIILNSAEMTYSRPEIKPRDLNYGLKEAISPLD